MKLVTFEDDQGRTKLGGLREDGVVDLLAEREEEAFRSMQALIEAGPDIWALADETIANGSPDAVVSKVLAPLPLPIQIRDSMCSHEHIRQCAWGSARLAGATELSREDFVAGYELPPVYSEQPVYYKCNRFAVGHPETIVNWPAYSAAMDFELELAAVIGTGGRDIMADEALDHVFGFTIFNDFSARDAQGKEMAGRLGPAKGKDFDGANVFGPCIVTTDEIGDPMNLAMTAKVNGEIWCSNNSSTINWSFGQLIEHISQGETLYPGEIICSGTVGGGCGLEHARFLKDGDEIELEIEKIGTLRNRVAAHRR